MYIRVDQEPLKSEVQGFAYSNKSGIEETVSTPRGGSSPTVTITDSCGEAVVIYRDDIPNLIKALQAAYDHKE